MGSVGDCYDNAMCESFFASLECELLDRRCFRTRTEARMAVFSYIEGWYNPRRRHSALGYESPMNFEKNNERSAAKSQACQDATGTATSGRPGVLLLPSAVGAAEAPDSPGGWEQRENMEFPWFGGHRESRILDLPRGCHEPSDLRAGVQG